MKKSLTGASAACVLAVATIAIAGGDWSGAERKYEEFKKAQEEFKKLLPSETKAIVTAICDAEEAERKSAASSAKSRAESTIKDKTSQLNTRKDDAEKMLRDVQADASLKDRHDKAKEYEADVKARWERAKSMKGMNHPVTAWMVEQGQKEHENYQKNSSFCHVYEFSMNSGRADCLIAGGSTCYVVELKPDNGRAIKKGTEQADDYTEELNNNADTRKNLVDKDSRFKDCTKFVPRVDCYKLCPELDQETNDMKSTSPVWRSRC